MAELPETEDEGAEIIFCRYGQCADRRVGCSSCIVLPADADEATIAAAIEHARRQGGENAT